MVEVIGLIATLFVLISFSLNSEKKIRIVNIIGAILFVIYGVLLGAWSVWILNGVLLLVHIKKLIKFK